MLSNIQLSNIFFYRESPFWGKKTLDSEIPLKNVISPRSEDDIVNKISL